MAEEGYGGQLEENRNGNGKELFIERIIQNVKEK